MDDRWFKARQRELGVTADMIADARGRDRSVISKIYSGKQRMTLEWAQAFADVLNVPVTEVLERAGVVDAQRSQAMRPGFAESDAALYTAPEPEMRRTLSHAEAFGGTRPGIDIWCVKELSMALMGYRPGDFILVNSHLSERAANGDVVVAQVYDNAIGSAKTVLRRIDTPVLVAAHPDPEQARAYVIDGVNVVVRGVVTASWRIRQ